MPLLHPEHIHPALWRASQIASAGTRRQSSGFPHLDRALGGGWPLGCLIELLPEQIGIGEVRLIKPALAGLTETNATPGHRRIALVAPPHAPSMQCWISWGLNPEDIVWVRSRNPGDTAWAAAQILHHQSCIAMLCWADSIAHTELLRLHRLARRGSTFTVLYRPRAAAAAHSPAGLRIMLRAIPSGVNARFLKCPDPSVAAQPLDLTWYEHALDQPASDAALKHLSGLARSSAVVLATADDTRAGR